MNKCPECGCDWDNYLRLLDTARAFVAWADDCWGSWAINSEDTPKAKADYEAAKLAISQAEHRRSA